MKNEPPRPAGIAFGDLLIARHISSKLGSALTPTSVPPINRGRVLDSTTAYNCSPVYMGTDERSKSRKQIYLHSTTAPLFIGELSVGLRGLNKGRRSQIGRRPEGLKFSILNSCNKRKQRSLLQLPSEARILSEAKNSQFSNTHSQCVLNHKNFQI